MNQQNKQRKLRGIYCESCWRYTNYNQLCVKCQEIVEIRNNRQIANQRLVRSYVNRYFTKHPLAYRTYSKEEAQSDGNIGLMRACECFDPTRGLTFSTYAWRWIAHFVQAGHKESMNAVHVPKSQGKVRHNYVTSGLEFILESPSELNELKEVLEAAMTRLDERGRDIVTRKGLQNETLESIARSYGMTKEGVRQIYHRSCAKMAKALIGLFK